MTYPYSHRTAATSYQPRDDSGDVLDTSLIDDEFDDFLDRHVATIRESLADFRQS